MCLTKRMHTHGGLQIDRVLAAVVTVVMLCVIRCVWAVQHGVYSNTPSIVAGLVYPGLPVSWA